MSKQTATERLRELLDERGVEWDCPSGLNSSFADSITFIGNVAVVSEIDGSDLLRINFDGTPEQAITATLGNDGVGRTNDGVAERTTTRNTTRTVYGNPRPVCEVCGYGIGDKRWGYCPKCGARIVEVD